MSLVFMIFTVQIVLGALDNFWHHEITERLPAKRAAATELSWHAVREGLYGVILFGLAWYEWRGAWAIVLAAMLVAEILTTLADFIVEDQTRKLPRFERVLHTILAMNYGIALAALAPILFAWWQMPSEIAPVSYGLVSWVFTVFSVGVLAWAVRNALAVLRHRRPSVWVRDPIMPGSSVSPRNVLISGATGFIGGHLVRYLIARGDSVSVFTRDADIALDKFGPHVRVITDLEQVDQGTRIDAVINLAGARILGLPWTRGRRRTLIESRVRTTRALVNLCARLQRPPRVFISASAIGYYGVREDERLDEQGEPQAIFQSELCQRWEEAAAGAESLGVRVVRLRIGMVFGRDGGALPSLAMPVRLGFGALLGGGKQWVSWIHIEDLVRLVEFALDKPSLRGAVNAVAPNPATHRQLQHTLAHSLRRRIRMRIPAFVLRAALGEMAQLLVDGQRVLPRRALAAGFNFRHPDLRAALEKLVSKPSPDTRAELTEMYYNGECPVCNFEMSHYARICENTEKSLKFIDASQRPEALAACGLRRDHVEKRVYLKDSSGRLISGLPALVQLWWRMPGYRWLARLSSLPVLKSVFAVLYDVAVAPTLAHWARSRAGR
jgi:uncharacterized protein